MIPDRRTARPRTCDREGNDNARKGDNNNNNNSRNSVDGNDGDDATRERIDSAPWRLAISDPVTAERRH